MAKRDPHTLRPRVKEQAEPVGEAPATRPEPINLECNERAELKQVKSHKGRYLRAKTMHAMEGTKETRRLQQQALYDLLWAFSTDEVDAISKDAAQDLAFAMREVLAGRAPDLFKPTLGAGETREPPMVIEAKVDAVRWIKYVEAGHLDSPPPARNGKSATRVFVAKIYGVHPGTVGNWMDEFGSKVVVPEGPDPSQDPEAWAEELERIDSLMRISGRNFLGMPGAMAQEAIRRAKKSSVK